MYVRGERGGFKEGGRWRQVRSRERGQPGSTGNGKVEGRGREEAGAA